MKLKKKFALATIIAGITGIYCLVQKMKPTMPKGAKPVSPFNVTRFLGRWYEIARLDYCYEQNLNHVTAEYTLKRNGKIIVNNQGLNDVTGNWEQSIGKLKFANSLSNSGALKVSFFGPIYSGFNVIGLDADYQYALIAGDSLKNLWLLSRTKQIPEPIKETYLAIANSLGYAIDKMVWVKHQKAG